MPQSASSIDQEEPTRRRCGCGCGCGSKRRTRPPPVIKVDEKSLEDQASNFSIWTLSFLNPLLDIGSRKILQEEDVGVPSMQDTTDVAHLRATEAWEEQIQKCTQLNEQRQADYHYQKQQLLELNNNSTCERKKEILKPPPKLQEPSMLYALVKSFGVWRVILGLLYYLISTLIRFIPILILNDLVKLFETDIKINDWDGIAHPNVQVVGLFVFPIISALFETRYQTTFAHARVFVRSAVSTMLYQKSLRVSPAGRAVTSTGQVVNIMSNDTNQLQKFLEVAGLMLVAPIQILIAVVLIQREVRKQ
jgi:hypothetical protein